MKTATISKVTPVVESNNAFAQDLYQRLRTQTGNLFFSPFSVSAALAMTYAGAEGETARQMAAVLHVPEDPDNLHSGFMELIREIETIQKKTKVELATANSLWPHSGYPLIKNFVKLVEKNYGAGLFPVDYERDCEGARGRINRWVGDRTNQNIKELIAAGILGPTTRLVLANAVYFKSIWLDEFDKDDTQDAPFYLGPESTVDVPLMTQARTFRYTELEGIQILSVPYVGKRLSMVIVLPRERDGLEGLEQRLAPGVLEGWMGQLRPRYVKAYLPRFRIRCGMLLNETLSSMGMPRAFSDTDAEFSRMSRGPMGLKISSVVHQAFVNVDEEGTEAAAATAVVFNLAMGGRLTAPPPPVIIFRADHPFLFLIKENDTGSILFMGRVTDPTRSSD